MVRRRRVLRARAPEGSYVGATPADRDAATLRAQLEPLTTFTLRRRLEEDFHQGPTDPATAQRPEVMRRLLECYDAEGGAEGRAVVDVAGAPVDSKICEEILVELRGWLSRRGTFGVGDRYEDRPSVCAEAYMTIRSPVEFQTTLGAGSRKSRQLEKVFERHARLWELAKSAVRSVDPAFADAFTALAVTSRFRGSPHVDKCNVGPFYGLALGDFEAGTGGICVECDARTIARVDTKNRLGKIDGRFPHWVAPYDETRSVSLSSSIAPSESRRPSPSPCSTPTSICARTSDGLARRNARISVCSLAISLLCVIHSANQRREWSSHPRRRRA